MLRSLLGQSYVSELVTSIVAGSVHNTTDGSRVVVDAKFSQSLIRLGSERLKENMRLSRDELANHPPQGGFESAEFECKGGPRAGRPRGGGSVVSSGSKVGGGAK